MEKLNELMLLGYKFSMYLESTNQVIKLQKDRVCYVQKIPLNPTQEKFTEVLSFMEKRMKNMIVNLRPVIKK